MALIWTQAIYEEMYDNYGRAWAIASGMEQWKLVLNQLQVKAGISAGSRSLVVGCGLGFLMEVAYDAGVPPDNFWGTDTSSYIQTLKNTDSRADVRQRILNINILSPTASNDLKSAGASPNGKFNWVISDLVVESLWDIDPQTSQPVNEITNFLNACDSLRSGPGGVVHVFASKLDEYNQNSKMHWEYRDWWKDKRPTHWWVDVHGWSAKTRQPMLVWNPNQGVWI